MPGQNALLSAVCLVPFMATAALAQTAGVTAAVNQSATGTPPGRAVRTISLGDNIVQNERINTSGEGLLQILLADGTAFTVGPNSALTIDRFVYDPEAGTAQVAATLARGVFRFVGGRTSKSANGVALDTPVGTVGIRGAVADISVNPGSGPGPAATFSMVFGNEITLTQPDGSAERVYRPGYTITVDRNGQASTIRTPPGAANQIQAALAGRPGTSGGSPNVPNERTVVQSPLPQLNSDARIAEIAPPIPTPRPPAPSQGDQDLVTLATLDTIRYEIALNTPPDEPQPPATPEPQPPVTPQPPTTPEPQPPTTPDPQPPVTPQPPTTPEPQPPTTPDPQPPVEPSPETRLRVYRASSPSYFDRTFLLGPGEDTSQVTVAAGRATGTLGGVPFDLPVFEDPEGTGTPAPLAAIEVGNFYGTPDENPMATFGSRPLSGTVYTGRDDFRAYLLATVPESSGMPSQAFYAVTGTQADVAATFSGGAVRSYAIQADPWIYNPRFAIPFGSLTSSGLPSTQSPLLLVEQPAPGVGQAKALQVSFGVDRDPGNPRTTQRSVINVVVGSVTGGGIEAVRRGGVRSDVSFVPNASYFGTLATLSGAQGGGFFGANGEYVVISGTPGAARPLYDRSVSDTPSETVFSRTQVASLQGETPTGTRREGLLQGFNASLLQVFEGSDGTTTLMRNSAPGDTRVNLTPGTNGLDGTFRSTNRGGSDVATRLSVGFGGADGPSAYVSQGQFAAVANTGGVELQTGEEVLRPGGDVGTYMVSGRVAEVSGFSLCSSCDFIEWGWWGTRAEGSRFVGGDGVTGEADASVHLGTFVAGDVTTNGQIAAAQLDLDGVPTTLDSATYAGGVIGTVRNGGDTYLARGDFTMGWNFASRVGNISISGFDGQAQSTSLTGSGAAGAGDAARFTQSEIIGTLNVDGAFVNGPASLPAGGIAAGVIGNFDWRTGGSWSATGIFGGTAQTLVPGGGS